jgi:nickel-dependent lactate racemase
MKSITLLSTVPEGLTEMQVSQAVNDMLGSLPFTLRKVLLVPPDYTRMHSYAGIIARLIWQQLEPGCRVDILPALGTHAAVSREEWETMYAGIPYERMLLHHWRDEVVRIGYIPGSFVSKISGGKMDSPIPVEINIYLLDPSYDLILSIGQVVPHEVAGMANHLKNILIGSGGSGMINASHMLGAVCGMESIMGRGRTTVRMLFDYAGEHFLKDLPLYFALTVTTALEDRVSLHGLFMGNERDIFDAAVHLSQEKNITTLDRPIHKAVVLLDEREFKSTWVGNKAVYRTRMAIADGGELFILAPGVMKFGEDGEADRLIRKYGYRGRTHILSLAEEQEDLQKSLSAAAHLIHGSSDGRFSITYCTRYLSREEVEGVGYRFLPYEEAFRRYGSLNEGWNYPEGGEEIYCIHNPAMGLWAEKGKI